MSKKTAKSGLNPVLGPTLDGGSQHWEATRLNLVWGQQQAGGSAGHKNAAATDSFKEASSVPHCGSCLPSVKRGISCAPSAKRSRATAFCPKAEASGLSPRKRPLSGPQRGPLSYFKWHLSCASFFFFFLKATLLRYESPGDLLVQHRAYTVCKKFAMRKTNLLESRTFVLNGLVIKEKKMFQ